MITKNEIEELLNRIKNAEGQFAATNRLIPNLKSEVEEVTSLKGELQVTRFIQAEAKITELEGEIDLLKRKHKNDPK